MDGIKLWIKTELNFIAERHAPRTDGRPPYTFRVSGFVDPNERQTFAASVCAYITFQRWGASVKQAEDYVRVDFQYIAQPQTDQMRALIENAIKGRRPELGYRHGIVLPERD